MSAAGIIAHCLATAAPPVETALVWWSAGDGTVQKVRDDGGYAREYLTSGADIQQRLIVDHERNRVFVPTQVGTYIFEGATANGDIPEPVLIENPSGNITVGGAAYYYMVDLDQTTGQAFIAWGPWEEVGIINTDNSVTIVDIGGNAYIVHALGAGRFSIFKDANELQVWGPSNAYAAPELTYTEPDTAVDQVWDADTRTLITGVDLDSSPNGLLRLINADTFAMGTVPTVGNVSPLGLYFVSDTGHVVYHGSGTLGVLYVQDPIAGTHISTIDYTAEIAGTLSGTPINCANIGPVLCILQRYTIAAATRVAMIVADTTTGTVIGSRLLPEAAATGLPYLVGADYEFGWFGVQHAATDKIYQISTDGTVYTGPWTYDTGPQIVAASYLPDL